MKIDYSYIKSNIILKYIIMLYGFSIPFSVAFPNILMIALVLYWFYAIYTHQVTFNKKIITLIIVYSFFYILTVASFFYSENTSRGLQLIIRKLPLLAYPLILFSVKFDDRKQTIYKTVLLFSISTTFVLSVNFLTAIYKWYFYPEFSFLNSITLGKLANSFFKFHYLYLGLFVSFSIVFNFYSLLFIKDLKKYYKKYFYLSLTLLFIFLFLLGGRNSIITTIFITSSLIFYHTIKNKKYKTFFYYSLFIITLMGVNFKTNPYMFERFKEVINYKNRYNLKDHWGGRGVRIAIWSSALEISKTNILFGVGVGDTQDLLTKKYKEKKINSLTTYKTIYNAHNMFIQHLLSIGLIGLLFTIISFIYPFFFSLKNKNYIHLLFIILFLITASTESLLERALGVSFLGFFHSLLYLYQEKN